MENDLYKETKKILDKERENFNNFVNDAQNEISILLKKCENYEKQISEMDSKIKDNETEILFLRQKTQISLETQKEYFCNTATNQELKILLKEKDFEIIDNKRKNDLTIKKLNEELFKLTEKNENLEDKLQEINSLKIQNEKLFTKVKEMNIYKDKKIEFENLLNTNETNNKQIELLVKEKQSFINQIDKLSEELQKTKEKLSICEYEKKNIEYDLIDLKKDYIKLENKQHSNNNNMMNISNITYNKNTQGQPIIGSANNIHNNYNYASNGNVNNNNLENILGANNINNNFNLDTSNENWAKLNEINESIIQERNSHNNNIFINNNNPYNYNNINNKNSNILNEQISRMEKEYLELNNEKNDIMKSLKEQIDHNQLLILERDKQKGEINHLKNLIEKLNNDIDKNIIEKGKLEIQIQKQELNIQSQKISNEYEIKKLEDSLKLNKEKNENFKSEIFKLNKEIENFKILLSYCNTNNIKNLNNKNQISTIVNEFNNYSNSGDKETKNESSSFLNIDSRNKKVK